MHKPELAEAIVAQAGISRQATGQTLEIPAKRSVAFRRAV